EEFPGQAGPAGDGDGQPGAVDPQTGPAPDGEAGPPEAAESDAERIARLEGELAETRDKWVRALAEAENIRRRAERDRRDAEAYGGTRLARDMLLVWDNLERAMKAADDELRANHGAFIEGVELTQRELLNAFAKHKIEKVTPERGEKFDPNRHQAMFEAPVPGAEPGAVIEVLQDGFVIADRLLRPAMVGVARAAPEAVAARPSPEGGEGSSEGTESEPDRQDGGQPS
ncbi:MAG TPA: nucleotide exchange factor GrpE, partial [Paracoccaceae bacterium]|nr:nucleotide exchange factor GrpE [Paracoccaceae bacterium]